MRERIGAAFHALAGRSIPPPAAMFTGQCGVPSSFFKPGESLRAFSDNGHLYDALVKIGNTIMRLTQRHHVVNA